MKRFVPAFAIVLGSAVAAWSAPSAPLTSLRAIHALSNTEASHGPPVAFEATVTYYRGPESTLFVQDGDVGIYVNTPKDAKFVPGDRVFVRGKLRDSFNPYVTSESITILRHGSLPKPIQASFEQMIRAEADCRLVTVRGVIRSTSFNTTVRFTNLEMITDGGYFDATVDGDNEDALEGLLDAEVELTGVASELFDGKMEVTGILIHVQSQADVRVLKRATANPWSLPVTSMGRVLGVYHVSDLTPRVRVHGTITYFEPGSTVILQDGAKSIWISTGTRDPLQIGDVADAIGFPDAHEGFLRLLHGEIRDSHTQAPVTPEMATFETLTPRGLSTPGHHYDLVSIEGKVVSQVRESSQDEYVVAADGKLFSAIYRHLDGPPSSTKEIPLGSRVRVTGICILEISNPFIDQVPFKILLRSFDDISVVARPSPLNVRNLIVVVGLLLVVIFAVGTRAWFVEHRARQHTAASAYVERRRGRILEDINGSRPLTEIIEQITELVSFRLRGAPCWVQIAGGARIGNCPKDLSGMRMAHQEIPAHSGPPLGEAYAAFDPLTKPQAVESESLSFAVGLAALAIETRRLYTDLIRRSEFDLLTDIHNRFSLDKRLDAQIEEAYPQGGIFGLIYIDLDNFKKVNDLLGHRIGDLYLQEMAMRMKRQLRSVDTLARLGGDEFAILVPVVRSRADVRDIALRLERCFDEPLSFEDVILHPAASVGCALYPEDATTKDGLLSAADDAMYEAKNAKRQIAELLPASTGYPLQP